MTPREAGGWENPERLDARERGVRESGLRAATQWSRDPRTGAVWAQGSRRPVRARAQTAGRPELTPRPAV